MWTSVQSKAIHVSTVNVQILREAFNVNVLKVSEMENTHPLVKVWSFVYFNMYFYEFIIQNPISYFVELVFSKTSAVR